MGRTKNFEGPDTLCLMIIKQQMERRFGRVSRGEHRGAQLRLVTDTRLLWAGKNYVMIHEGPHEGSRDVVLYSRVGVFLKNGNPGNNAMLEIALAAVDPDYKVWSEDYQRLLWRSGKYGGGINELRDLRGARFSKKTRARCIEFAEELERTHDERFEAFKRRRAEQKSYADAIGQTLLAEDVPVQTRSTKSHAKLVRCERFVPERLYSVPLSEVSSRNFRFRVLRNGKITVKWDDPSFTPEEFEILAKAVSDIYRLRNRE